MGVTEPRSGRTQPDLGIDQGRKHIRPVVAFRSCRKPSASPSDLADRLRTLGTSRSRVLLRHAFGEVADTADVLERLAEAIRILDEATPDDTPDETARADTLPTPSPSRRAPRRSATP